MGVYFNALPLFTQGRGLLGRSLTFNKGYNFNDRSCYDRQTLCFYIVFNVII